MAENFVNVTEGSGKMLHTFNRTIGANDVHDEGMFLAEQNLASYMVVTASTSTATAASHLLQIMAGSSLRVRIRRIEVHQSVLATTASLYNLQIFRLTTAGTGGTTVTPRPLDSADAASGATAMTLPTVKGTEGVMLYESHPYFLQTAGASTSFPNPIMAVDFDRPRSKPLIIPSGTANGICIKVSAAIAGAQAVVNVWLDESSFV